MIDMGNYAKTYMPGLYAIVYFDVSVQRHNWNLDTSTSSMDWVQVVRERSVFQHSEPVED